MLPMANLENKGNFKGKIWGTFLPIGDDADERKQKRHLPRRARLPIRRHLRFQRRLRRRSTTNLQKTNRCGQHLLSRRRNIRRDWLRIENRPGVPFVYAGFAGLLVTSFLSLLSHSQVWGVQKNDGNKVLYVSGTSNRGKEEFRVEFDQVLDELPEYI